MSSSDEGPLINYACHVLKTKIIRCYHAENDELFDKTLPDELFPTNWKSDSAIAEYIRNLIKLIPKKLDCLVLVNNGYCRPETSQAAFSGILEGTTVRMIPALLARFIFILNNIEPSIENGQSIAILTKISHLSECHSLRRANSVYSFVNESQKSSTNIAAGFSSYIQEQPNIGQAVVFYDEQNSVMKDEVLAICNKNGTCMDLLCPQWDEMLLCGGLMKASAIMEPDSVNDVKDFCIGFQLVLDNNDESNLIECGTSVPFRMRFQRQLNKKVVIRSTPMIVFKDNDIKRIKNVQYANFFTEGLYNVEIEIDKNGLEKISILDKTADLDQSSENTKVEIKFPLVEAQKPLLKYDCSFNDTVNDSFALPDLNEEKIFVKESDEILEEYVAASTSQIDDEKSLILPKPADFMICLKERECCICIPDSNDPTKTSRIKTINDNEWIPMYISLLQMPPSLGEEAVADLKINPECVIYDILTFISTPYDRIKINPEWAFNVAYMDFEGDKSDRFLFLEVQTFKGPYAVDPIQMLGLFFIALQKEAEEVAGKPMNTVFIKMVDSVTKEASNGITKALKMANLECIGIESLPILK